jgi:hypothetical protein
MAELRKQPGPPCGKPLPGNFLKHADEQTVAGVAAVFQAIHDSGLAPDGSPALFRQWGVVAAPRFLGRSAMASDLPRFLAEGAWDVSPHMIPHRSLHAASGTLSQALKIHGPNFGGGGGPGNETEGLLAGVAMLEGMRLPGVWVVLTRMHPELPDDGKSGRPVPGSFAWAVALALRPAGSPGGVHLELTISQSAGIADSPLTMDALIDLLGQIGPSKPPGEVKAAVSHPLGASGRLTLRRADLPLAGPHFALLSSERTLQDR